MADHDQGVDKMSLLSKIINEPPQVDQPILILQSSASQSCLPLIRQIMSRIVDSSSGEPTSRPHTLTLLFCLFYHPSTLLEKNAVSSNSLKVYDWTSHIPGYDDSWLDPGDDILSAVRNMPLGSINVVIDSVDTLLSDVGSLPKTYEILRDLQSSIRARQGTSRLMLHVLQSSPLLPLLAQTAFTPSLIHISAHHPSLLTYLAKEYLTPPPPLSLEVKFWSVFLPVSERTHDTDRLIFGAGGEGNGNSVEFILDILIRGLDATSRKRGVERVLEGWSLLHKGACDLMALETLKNFESKKAVEEKAPDPTQNVSFNLNLTPSQQQSRAQVPLPYAHEGKPLGQQNPQGSIFYDPDSADDIDDDDPDDDLDI